MKSEKQIKSKIQRERSFQLALFDKWKKETNERKRDLYYESIARQAEKVGMLRWVLKS